MAYAGHELQVAPLAVLAKAINHYEEIILGHTRNALQVALDEGDALRWAKDRVGNRQWKTWRQQNCPKIAERTDVLRRRLAAHRPRIEQSLAKNPDLTLREAVKLISTPKPRPAQPKPAALEKWRILSNSEKREGLGADGIDALLEYMPPEWRDQLADRLARVKHKTAQDRGLSARLRAHIESHPEDRLARYIRDRAIDLKHVIVHVGAIDAPSKRRPPLNFIPRSPTQH